VSDFTFYYQSIDDTTLTYSAIEDTNYPVENIQDRNLNTFFKDTNAGATVYITIDLGSGNSRAVDYFLLGNYIFTVDGLYAYVSLEGSNTGAFAGEQTTIFSNWDVYSGSLNTKLKTFTKSSAYRYFRIKFEDSGLVDIYSLKIATIFMGEKWNHSHNPEIGISESGNYDVRITESGGGVRYSQIVNEDVRRRWEYQWKYITESEKDNWETWRDSIQCGGKYSRYPFYFTDDDTNYYFVRSVGNIKLKEIAYNAWETSLTLEEEL
jgi:hypothetical protein